MKKSLICLAVLAVMSQPVLAEKWSAIGILVTKVNGNEIDAKALELDDFESSDLCWQAVKRYSHSDETIGKGGTDHEVPKAEWNYDGDCFQKRSD